MWYYLGLFSAGLLLLSACVYMGLWLVVVQFLIIYVYLCSTPTPNFTYNNLLIFKNFTDFSSDNYEPQKLAA